MYLQAVYFPRDIIVHLKEKLPLGKRHYTVDSLTEVTKENSLQGKHTPVVTKSHVRTEDQLKTYIKQTVFI